MGADQHAGEWDGERTVRIEEQRHRDGADKKSEGSYRLADQLAACERLGGEVTTAFDQLLALEAFEPAICQGSVGPRLHKKTDRSIWPRS